MGSELTSADQSPQSPLSLRSPQDSRRPHGPDAAFIRRYRPQDAEAVADICVRTADAGQDATGLYRDESVLADLFALPYVTLDPDLAFVLDDGTGRAVGYVLGTDDTRRFAERFRDEWLPLVADRHEPDPGDPSQGPDELMAWLLHHPERLDVPGLEAYPAHMHIDLLPSHQRRGHGGRLLEALLRELTARSDVARMHVGMLTSNKPARAFYDRKGFHRIPIDDPALTYLGITFN
ncbi:MAG TPA: GNAT family N-acetyltransferase [Actinospica sp.]|jgi:GNAT superfamily N-acetyltransferase|nr:GNAT family N-acetyltransferase [Actinospica sp.]